MIASHMFTYPVAHNHTSRHTYTHVPHIRTLHHKLNPAVENTAINCIRQQIKSEVFKLKGLCKMFIFNVEGSSSIISRLRILGTLAGHFVV